MGWVTEAFKAILLEHGTQYFEKKGDDRENHIDDVVDLLKATGEEFPDKVR